METWRRVIVVMIKKAGLNKPPYFLRVVRDRIPETCENDVFEKIELIREFIFQKGDLASQNIY